ncbi:hypothetical protein C4J81_01630 [Deltaproteobacteria bacterium Smac51]|nr:hypothetical protein C4J81_01630 [Deltaproteobacteria bacterium Smac51]
MSKKSQNVKPSSPPNTNISPETIIDFTEKLQELTEAVLALSQPSSTTEEPSRKKKEPDQIRCYRVPGRVVREERESLIEYKADNLLDILQKAHNEFFIISYLLRNFNECEDVAGEIMYQIGDHLAHPIAMLSRLCDMFVDFHPQSFESDPDC